MTGLRPIVARRAAPVVALALVVATSTGCGVGAEPDATRLDDDTVPFGLLGADPPGTAPEGDANGPGDGIVHFVRGECLVAVRRDGAAAAAPALAALLGGPDAAERAADLRSPVAALSSAPTLDPSADPMVIELPEEFVELPPSEQRLGIAQLVVTLSVLVPANEVVFRVGGSPVAVPGSDGAATTAPVAAGEYAALTAATCTSAGAENG